MLERKTAELSDIQTEVFNMLVGYKEESQLNKKKVASRRSLQARRGIEQHFEDKALRETTRDAWFDEG